MDTENHNQTMGPRILAGRYEVGPLLGVGGMAEVYEGHDRLLARRVAIKVLLAQYAHDPAFLARFRREAQAAASLSHPNIVAVFDTGSQDDIWFIVMEYVAGRTLRDVINAEGPVHPARAAERGAVDHADRRGDRHRPVHRAGAGPGPRGGCKERSLLPRLLPVRDADRPGAVHRADAGGDRLPARAGQPDAATPAEPGRLGVAGAGVPEGDGQAARRPVPDGARDAPGPGPGQGGRAGRRGHAPARPADAGVRHQAGLARGRQDDGS